MKAWLKIALICQILLLVACGGGKNTGAPSPSIRSFKTTCVPESQLYTAGIVGGQVVQPGDQDSKLVVMIMSGNESCTAAAIGPDVLLTAAHCIAGDKNDTRVVFYPSVSCESGFNSHRDMALVKDIIVNENYVPSTEHSGTANDLALIFLNDPVPAGYSIYSLASMPSSATAVGDLYLYGYGITSSDGTGAGILRKTSIEMNNYQIDLINKKVVIDQTHGSGVCQGDSGGPGLINENGELKILGINSYVSGPKDDICSAQAYQTLAPAFANWINQKIQAYKAGER